VNFDKLDGLVPAVVQDDESGEVLMVGFMNREALQETVASGCVTFFSRTRRRLWTKGESSGNRLRVTRLLVDCDEDTLLVRAVREGAGNVCHTGKRSCFFRDLDVSAAECWPPGADAAPVAEGC
jgi:phosphoribosyl-AMP cyclohydrolase